jgi:hypothetical protein
VLHAGYVSSLPQVVEEGYEFFAKRQLVTIFSAPNYCGEFENAGAMMSVDETLMCSFQVRAAAACRAALQCESLAVFVAQLRCGASLGLMRLLHAVRGVWGC